MRLIRSRLGLLAGSVAMAVGCASLAGCGGTPAGASTPQLGAAAKGKDCIHLHFFENTTAYYRGNSATGVGAVGSYHDRLWASSAFAKQIGAGMGTFAVTSQDSVSGDLIEYSTEQDQFAGGSFVISDYFDRTLMLAGHWVGGTDGAGMYVKGTSGRYLGMTGKVVWRILSLTKTGVPTELKYVLCGKRRASG